MFKIYWPRRTVVCLYSCHRINKHPHYLAVYIVGLCLPASVSGRKNEAEWLTRLDFFFIPLLRFAGLVQLAPSYAFVCCPGYELFWQRTSEGFSVKDFITVVFWWIFPWLGWLFGEKGLVFYLFFVSCHVLFCLFVSLKEKVSPKIKKSVIFFRVTPMPFDSWVSFIVHTTFLELQSKKCVAELS